MPRIFMSVETRWRILAAAGNRLPALRLPALGALRRPRKRRQHDEVDTGEHEVAEDPGERGHDPQIPLPEPARSCRPDAAARSLGRHTVELSVAVVHVEDFV